MTDNEKLKEEILKSKYLHSLSKLEKQWIYECMEQYHLARLEIPEKEIDEMATQYDNGGLNQSQWVGFIWGAKAIIEKLKQV